MTITLYWAFVITTFLTGAGATCGIASSPEYVDEATCETARLAYEASVLSYQTPTRRIGTLPCQLAVRR